MSKATPVLSPCINICVMQTEVEAIASGHTAPLCKGCARTIAEIAAWGGMSDTDKQAIWQQLPQRQARLRPPHKPPSPIAKAV
jgi:uncharacterized protein